MATFRSSGITGGITGSVLGLTFRTSRGRGIIQSKPNQRRYKSSRQITTNKNFAAIAARWLHTLTSAQRAAWERYAQCHPLPFHTRRTAKMPGYNAYLQHNIVSVMAGHGFLDTAPAYANILPIFGHGWGWNPSNRIFVNWGAVGIPAGTTILLSLSHPFPASQASPRITFRQHWTQAGPKTGYGEYYISGAMRSGLQARFYSRQVRDDGRFSEYLVQEKTWP